MGRKRAKKNAKAKHSHSQIAGNDKKGIAGEFEAIAQQFAIAGGQRCLNFFQSLFTNWKNHGALPALTSDESNMLNELYKLWQESRHAEKKKASKSNELKLKYTKHNSLSKMNSGPDGWKLAVEDVKRETGKEQLLKMCNTSSIYGRDDGMRNIVTHLDILLKSPEPTKTHAKNLLVVLSSTDMKTQDLSTIERQAQMKSTAHMVALGFILDSQVEHITNVKKNTSKKPHDESQSNVLFSKQCYQLYLGAADLDDAIGAMQVGGKYFRGEGVTQDYKLALKYYTKAAVLNNPIAQHKVGYFYDAGLEGACSVDIHEAIKWYSKAADYMPDSVHNLAKIYEEGRVGKANLTMAVSMYSIAAARGFTQSQLNLSRLFIRGGPGIIQDLEAGKRLLLCAAESGDCDAQLVLGMMHTSPAFGIYELPLAEYWLRCSLQSGKPEAELPLIRVVQQMHYSSIPVIPSKLPYLSKCSMAAKLRGDDYFKQHLVEAAALEYTRAFELDGSKTSYIVDRMNALFVVGHFEECILDGTQLIINCYGLIQASAKKSPEKDKGSGQKSSSGSSSAIKDKDGEYHEPLSQEATRRVYCIIAESLVELHWAEQSSIPFDVLRRLALTSHKLCTSLVHAILGLLLESSNVAQKALTLLISCITLKTGRYCRLFVSEGAIPMIIWSMSQALCGLGVEKSRSGGNKVGQDILSKLCTQRNMLYYGISSSRSAEAEAEGFPLEAICANGASALTNIVGLLHEPCIVSIIAASDGFPLLIKLSICKQVDIACEALQALSNIAVQADEVMWKELLNADIVSTFVDVISIALEDLGQLAQGVELEGVVDDDREPLWQDIFEVLEGGIYALGRVMEICPVEFALLIAESSLLMRLQKLFRFE